MDLLFIYLSLLTWRIFYLTSPLRARAHTLTPHHTTTTHYTAFIAFATFATIAAFTPFTPLTHPQHLHTTYRFAPDRHLTKYKLPCQLSLTSQFDGPPFPVSFRFFFLFPFPPSLVSLFLHLKCHYDFFLSFFPSFFLNKYSNTGIHIPIPIHIHIHIHIHSHTGTHHASPPWTARC